MNTWHYYRECDTVFVFVHGILSDGLSAWGNYDLSFSKKNNPYWPEIVKLDRAFDNPSIFVAGYYTEILSSEFSIDNATQQLYDGLTKSSDHIDVSVIDKTRIIFVAHSLGGIITRNMIVKYSDVFKEKKIGLLLVASPSLGSKDANYIDLVSGFLGNKMIKQLRRDSDFLDRLDKEFRNYIKDEQEKSIVGAEAIENHPYPSFLRYFGKEKTVPIICSGRYFVCPSEFDNPHTVANTNHSTIAKPNDENHPSHRYLRNFYTNVFIRQFGAEESQIVPEEDIDIDAITRDLKKLQENETMIKLFFLTMGINTEDYEISELLTKASLAISELKIGTPIKNRIIDMIDDKDAADD
ncbi:MAG: hypothetical protein AAFO06_19175 [Cyanobacteria bacterium J06597_16]